MFVVARSFRFGVKNKKSVPIFELPRECLETSAIGSDRFMIYSLDNSRSHKNVNNANVTNANSSSNANSNYNSDIENNNGKKPA